ncbi:hypothetical protein G1K75_12685 [Tenacibaculum finnmarkense]|uniref:hypothetical protein n=1 Tax=Tenacibaculum finnmarkense TaxID=2781243 RepID=UPI001EFB6CF4|nr:hypothetical protein [Tenacibaculum finnmarkense]MCG8806508.1 hypothetical protein [Tenacibaculum finnmarkense]MCG8857656.1 hypothetical protein [Tenacibaculum finnmarkense]
MFIENLNSKTKEEIQLLRNIKAPLILHFEEKPDIEKLQLINNLVLNYRNDTIINLKSRANNWIDLNYFESISDNICKINFLTFNKTPKFDNLDGIEVFKQLKEIAFSYNYSNSIDLDKLSSCPELEYINLENAITKKHHNSLNKIKKLKTLKVKGLDASLLTEMPNLKDLQVMGLKNGDGLDIKMPNLQDIGVHSSNKLENLDFLKGLKSIESITLDGISNVESLPDLENLKKLNVFSVMNMRRLEVFSNFNIGIERLRIGKNIPLLTPNNLKMLTSKKLPNLKDITIDLKTRDESNKILQQFEG